MTDTTEIEEPPAAKSSRLPMIIGLVLALAGGGGGFYAAQSGLLFGAASHPQEEMHQTASEEPLPDVVFVPLDPIVVSLVDGGSSHLRFRAQLEVPGEYASDVEHILPRIVDVLNSYLRALSPADIEAPDALVRLRAQMLRRAQIVTGQGRVRDLLIMEFVLN
ncbi:flagellar basal body-associated FliL family protein [Shimia aestuarii]|uniref:Flagellar protein FliL n=1 Tax=Shimia aestuarii TaxID=254406 RepID=A0A1I4KA35_9RHOB|nr:flagellar basal body-associated FliL family protein [Shimia aestuarii]SFL75675.1 flagellar FliL protein [Shimia aestuarii]